MANTFYGINVGEQEHDIAKDTSTNSTDIELNVDDSNAPTKQDVLLALEYFKRYILKDTDF